MLAVVALMAVWLLPASSAAQPAHATVEEQTLVEELKAETDPTIFRRRAWLETEWNKFRDGSHDVEETLGGLWAWRVSDNQDWGVRFKLPYEWHVAGHDAGDSDEHGLGDIKAATGTAFRLGETWRAFGGLDLRMPTAQNDLGDNVWRLQEIGAVAWDATPWLTFSPSFEYNESVAERGSAPPQHYVETYFPATCLLPRLWSVTAQYEAKVDFEHDNYWTHSAKFAIARQLHHAPLGFALSIKRSFDAGEKELQINLVINYYFRSKQSERVESK